MNESLYLMNHYPTVIGIAITVEKHYYGHEATVKKIKFIYVISFITVSFTCQQRLHDAVVDL